MAIATKQGRRVRLRLSPERTTLTIFTLAIVAAIVTPLITVVVISLQKQTGFLRHIWSGVNYQELLSPQMLSSALNSLFLAVGTMALAITLGVTLSWLVARTNLPLRRTFEVLNLIPFFLSPLIGSIAWTYLADPRIGFINRIASNLGFGPGPVIDIHSLGGMILVLGLFETPFVVLLTGAAFRQMDSSLEYAAQACGASGWRTWVRITLPLAGPSILSAAILIFVIAFEDLSVPLVLGYSNGIQTLGTRIFDSVQIFPPNYNFGAAIGVVMMLTTAAGLYLQRRAMRDRGYTTVTGKGSRTDLLRLGVVGRWLAFAIEFFFFLLAAALPIGSLALIAFSKQWNGDFDITRLTFDNFFALFRPGSIVGVAFVNSLTLSTVCAFIAVALSVLLVYSIERARIAGRRGFEVLLTIPVAVPGLVLATGILALLLRSPLFGTLLIIGIAYIVRFLPFAQRSISAAFLSVHPELEEAARTSGASFLRYTFRVLLPLVRPGLVAGWLLVFLTFMREFPMSALLQTTNTQTLSVALLNSLSFNSPGETAAFTLLQAAVLLAAAGIFWTITTRGESSASNLVAGL